MLFGREIDVIRNNLFEVNFYLPKSLILRTNKEYCLNTRFSFDENAMEFQDKLMSNDIKGIEINPNERTLIAYFNVTVYDNEFLLLKTLQLLQEYNDKLSMSVKVANHTRTGVVFYKRVFYGVCVKTMDTSFLDRLNYGSDGVMQELRVEFNFEKFIEEL